MDAKTRQWIKQVHTFLRPGLFLVAYHTSATLFPFHPDLLPMLGSLFALIAILFLLLDRTMEARSREIEIAHRQTQVLVALAKEGEPFGSAGKRGRTRAAAAKIEEVKETLEAKIIKAERRLRSEWRFVVVLIAIVLLEFQALLSQSQTLTDTLKRASQRRLVTERAKSAHYTHRFLFTQYSRIPCLVARGCRHASSGLAPRYSSLSSYLTFRFSKRLAMAKPVDHSTEGWGSLWQNG